MSEAIIVDVDGTLAMMGNRGVFEFEKAFADNCNADVSAMVNSWRTDDRLSDQRTVLVVTGRHEKFRALTRRWLDEAFVMCDHLLMRPDGDYRSSHDVKLEIYNQKIRDQYTIVGAFDDRMKDAKMWRELGITTYYVGDFTDF